MLATWVKTLYIARRLAMMNKPVALSQSETANYFEWITLRNNFELCHVEESRSEGIILHILLGIQPIACSCYEVKKKKEKYLN